jgi:nucleotide-binding universal stress UspA family protein
MILEPTYVRIEAPRNFLRLLVPVDFTPASLDALRHAGIVAERFGSMIYVLHVIESHPFAMNEWAFTLVKSDRELASETPAQLSRLAKEALSPELPAIPLVRRGQPAREILRVAETLKPDLLILVRHRRSVLGRLPAGDTIARVERRAPCPVLVVRCKDDPGTETALWRETDVDNDRSRLQQAA